MKRRKRYSCCGGSLTCSLNVIEHNVDKVLRKYRRNRKAGRRELMNWILCLEDDVDWYKYKAKELWKEKLKKGEGDMK